MRHPQRLTARPARAVRPARAQPRAGLVELLFVVAGPGIWPPPPRTTVAPTVASSRVTDALVGVGFGVPGLVTIIFSLLFLVGSGPSPACHPG